MPELAADVIKQWEHLEGQRGPWKSHWQQVTDYVLPDRADYYVVKTAGTKRMQKVFDATPVWALQQFASGLHSLLTSPTLRWFGCKPDEDHLADDHDAHQWWDIVTEVMYGIFNGASHNFASQSHELYLDLGAVGTGVMSVTESDQSGILFSTRHLRECCIAENDEDRVDTLIRRWFYTAKQAAQRWGAAAGPAVLKAYEETPDKLFEFLHAVRPRKERALGRSDRRNKAWESVYVSLADKSEIDVGGFDDFPYLVPRFSKITGETYGRGPGMWCLPDIQMLNVMGKTVLKAAQKIVDPPLFIPDDGYIVPIKTEPGSFNYYPAGSQDRVIPLETRGNPQLGIELIQALRQQITRGFYVEWMMMPSDPSDPAAAGKGVTATYVLQQRDEKMRLLSPMLARMQSEFLGPLIGRTFGILWRQSQRLGFGPGSPLPPPPPQLSGARWRIEYVSPIAVAQKASQLDGINRVIQTGIGMVQINPGIGKLFDTEAILRLAARDLNTPAAVLKSPERLQAEDQAAAQAQQALNGHMALANTASAAKDGTAAILNLANAQKVAGGGQVAA